MSQPPSDFKVRNAEIEETLRTLGRKIKDLVPPGWGFTLLMFDYAHDGDTGSMFYLSSATRDDMCKAMREFLAKQEGQVH